MFELISLDQLQTLVKAHTTFDKNSCESHLKSYLIIQNGIKTFWLFFLGRIILEINFFRTSKYEQFYFFQFPDSIGAFRYFHHSCIRTGLGKPTFYQKRMYQM